MKNRIELLAPCGNHDALIAAVSAGADAVYLATNRFGARGYAGNFTYEEVAEAISYCHIRGVKVYVTMNTLIYENEMDAAMEQVDFLYQHDVDAIIVQDLGLLEVVGKVYPDLELHASTQMHIHNLNGAEFIVSKGIKRVVVARETPLEVIERITAAGIDVEAFSYGALCVSYSGQCLLSSVLKNRSGNRGVCAQLCRLPFRVYDVRSKRNLELKDEYLLSLRDLNTIDDIPALIEAGISSLKIEGRMKRFEYVSYITSIYRMAIDAFYKGETFTLSEEQKENLKKLFNRGFTRGYLFKVEDKMMINTFRPNHMGIDLGRIERIKGSVKTIRLDHDLHQHDGLRIISRNGDIGLVANRIYQDGLLVNSARAGETIDMEISDYCNVGDKVVLTSDQLQLKEIGAAYQKLSRRVMIRGTISLIKDERINLTIDDGENRISVQGVNPVQKALKTPLTREKIASAIEATGNSVYEFSELGIRMEDDVFTGMKELKQLRRDAIAKLDESRSLRHRDRRGKLEYSFDEYPIELTHDNIYEISDISQYHEDGINYSNNRNISNGMIKYKTASVDHYDTEPLSEFVSQIGNLRGNSGFICNSTFNAVNSYALKFLFDCNARMVILSNELTDIRTSQMLEAFAARYNTAANVAIMNYGRRVLMTLKYRELLKYAYPDYRLVVDNNYLCITSDSLGHMLILEEKPLERAAGSDLITNRYYRLLLDDKI